MTTTFPRQAEEVLIPTDAGDLPGILYRPQPSRGLVIFAHGSGSSRFSSRNRAVAETFNHSGIATLLFDLLTTREHDIDQRTAVYRFDIPLLTRRLIDVVDWAAADPRTAPLTIGLFGASTGAAAALGAAAARPELVRTLVSRGGRPDLAAEALRAVQQPALFIVGSLDQTVLALNRDAAARMPVPAEIRIIDGASHLFEEAGKLAQMATVARRWFRERL
jgi:dienelactone hydrolase